MADNPLAPYGASRPFVLLRITQSYAPDVQWVGGRAGAVGVNRGERAALDSTLVWLRLSDGDEITSPVSVGAEFDPDAVAMFGGQPTDSLEDRQTYTIWVATREAYDASLSGGAITPHTLVDTTFTPRYLLNGRSGGGVDVNFVVFREESLLRDVFTVQWTPSDVAFRRIAIRKATVGGFTDLIWHVVLPEDMPDVILSPVVIGEPPPDAIEVTEWTDFDAGSYVLWAATSDWEGRSFGFATQGYAFFQIFASNFEE